MNSDKEFEFTSEDFDFLRGIVTKTTGIVAPDDKYTMYYSRLARRLRTLGLSTFAAYRDFLKNNQETESIELVNAVTTNLTSFFREKHHFDYIRDTLIPKKASEGDYTLRIWSAGCSTGEEPYTIAMTLLDAISDNSSSPDRWDIKILATDIDSNVLKTGSAGVYDASRVSSLDVGILRRYFKKGSGSNQGKVRVNPILQEHIQFKQLNLLHDWPINDRMDYIFCRNVVIYFDKETKAGLVNRFASQLKDDGILFMGHSESLYKTSDRFSLLGKTIYQLAIN
ncbi:MAG: protein-glutamate O-methyltransferase CheR [Gammaproteobacteria bacterium]|nr:protein-glutamate O-methyltransferase CheR [Gammaproteobacteria bacterium]